MKGKTAKIIIPTPKTKDEQEGVVKQMQNLCENYVSESDKWLRGFRVAGARARNTMYDIKRNAPTVNQAMIDRDKK